MGSPERETYDGMAENESLQAFTAVCLSVDHLHELLLNSLSLRVATSPVIPRTYRQPARRRQRQKEKEGNEEERERNRTEKKGRQRG